MVDTYIGDHVNSCTNLLNTIFKDIDILKKLLNDKKKLHKSIRRLSINDNNKITQLQNLVDILDKEEEISKNISIISKRIRDNKNMAKKFLRT